MKNPSVSVLKRKLDIIFSEYIRARDAKLYGGKCITCGSTTNLQAGHFQKRSHNSTRYDEQNVAGQCAKCNCWGGGEQYEFGKQIDIRYGKGTADKLRQKALEIKKWTAPELKELIEYYQEKLKEA